MTFKEGVVIPAGGTLYVSPNVYLFRKRTDVAPGGKGAALVELCARLAASGEAAAQPAEGEKPAEAQAEVFYSPARYAAAQDLLRDVKARFTPE